MYRESTEQSNCLIRVNLCKHIQFAQFTNETETENKKLKLNDTWSDAAAIWLFEHNMIVLNIVFAI